MYRARPPIGHHTERERNDMNIRRQRTGQFAASICALAVMLGALPLALIAASRTRFGSPNPLADIPVPWRWSASDLTDAASEPLQDDAVINLIVRSALMIAWIALVVIAITTVFEVVHMMRHRGLPRPRVRGLNWAQSIARFIAVGLIAILPSTSIAAATTTTGDLAAAPTIGHVLGIDINGSTLLERQAGRRSASAQPVERHVDTETGPGSASSDPVAGTTHLVSRGESVWEIAEQLGDGDEASTLEIADAILDANLGRMMSDGHRFTNPAIIRQGWTLELPGTVASSAELVAPTPYIATIHPDAVVVERVAETEPPVPAYVVVEGDTLSGIADRLLGNADDWPMVFEANDGDEMPDGRTLDNPNLILPGWELDIPEVHDESDTADSNTSTPGTDPTTLAEPEAAPVVAVPLDDLPTGTDTVEEDADAGSSPEDPDPIDPPSAPVEVDQPVVATTEPAAASVDPDMSASVDLDMPRSTEPAAPPTPTESAATSTESTEAPEAPEASLPTEPAATSTSAPRTTSTTTPPVTNLGDAGSAGPRPIQAPQAPSPIRLEHAALLAAGILTLVGVRRARRLRGAPPRARVPVPPPDIAATERRLRTIEPGEGAARLDIALRAAAHELAETGTQIGLVRLSTDGHVLLRLTNAGRLEAPWVGIGQDWELPASIPIELLADAARRAGTPCVALTQIGVDALGRSVLVDLEAAGVTAVEARPAQADEVVTAIATAVASSLHSEVAHLITVAIDSGCFLDHPNAHQRRSTDAAVDLAIALIGSTATNERSTFDLRAMRTSGEMWEPAIVFLGASDCANDSIKPDSLPSAGHGLALVCATSVSRLPGPCIRIVAHADRWELDAFGERTVIAPIGLDARCLDEVTALLDDAVEPIELPVPVLDEMIDAVDEPFEALAHDIVVGLLGGVEIRSATGELGSFERSKTVELLAWLATHRDRATRTSARTALWELDVRDATFANVVSEARRALGRLVTTPDGEEWLARTLNESLPLHERVVTDADLVEQRLEHARLSAPSHAIDVLRPAVELIRDMPFAGTSYLWPDADGITSNLVLLATTVTAELAAHALSVGDTETVFWATGHGLRVLPGHEELIALRMRARARAGDLAGVRQEWESYERVIVADAWSDGEPAPMLLELRRVLLSSPT